MMQSMSEDLIKRSDAIKALNREKSDWNCDYNVPVDNCIKRLNKVKPADRPQGEWIDKGGYAICSNCRAHSEAQYDGVPVPLKTRYCPNCGFRMKGAEND